MLRASQTAVPGSLVERVHRWDCLLCRSVGASRSSFGRVLCQSSVLTLPPGAQAVQLCMSILIAGMSVFLACRCKRVRYSLRWLSKVYGLGRHPPDLFFFVGSKVTITYAVRLSDHARKLTSLEGSTGDLFD